jgi:hypothetical protein
MRARALYVIKRKLSLSLFVMVHPSHIGFTYVSYMCPFVLS